VCYAVASNYDSEFNTDDGSCRYDVSGCASAAALNYDSVATISTNCDFLVVGCLDTHANNFAPDANRYVT
jgi:hypothetical protein